MLVLRNGLHGQHALEPLLDLRRSQERAAEDTTHRRQLYVDRTILQARKNRIREPRWTMESLISGEARYWRMSSPICLTGECRPCPKSIPMPGPARERLASGGVIDSPSGRRPPLSRQSGRAQSRTLLCRCGTRRSEAGPIASPCEFLDRIDTDALFMRNDRGQSSPPADVRLIDHDRSLIGRQGYWRSSTSNDRPLAIGGVNHRVRPIRTDEEKPLVDA